MRSKLTAGQRIEFKVRLRRLLMERGISQVELAQKVGVTRQSISLFLNEGKNNGPSAALLGRIAEALDVPPGWLTGDE